jgi:putative Ig domain-containing protein
MRGLAIGVAVGALCMGCGESAPPPSADAAPAAGDFAAAAANRAPILESVRIDPSEPAQGAIVHAVVTARDPDGQGVVLTHRWFVDGAEQGTGDATFALDQAAKGAEIRVSVTASDGVLVSDAVDDSVRVIDRSPSITQAILVPSGPVAPGQTLNARAGAMDPDNDPVDFEYTWYVNGERREGQGALFATDKLAHGDSIYAEVRATDGSTWTDAQRTPVVTIGNAHPEILSTPPGFREDGEFRYKVEAVDPDGDKRLRYALEKGPDGMVIDDITGNLVWRPRSGQIGVHPVTVVVRDSGGLETKQSFSVTMQEKVETVAVPQGRHRVREPKPEAPASPEQ